MWPLSKITSSIRLETLYYDVVTHPFKMKLGRWYFLSFPHDAGFVLLCADLTCGMHCVKCAVLHSLLLSHYGMKVLQCWPDVCSRGGLHSERRIVSLPLSTTLSTFSTQIRGT